LLHTFLKEFDDLRLTFSLYVEDRIDILTDIVSSGLIPALLYKVGLGADKDIRYLKIVVNFIYKVRVVTLRSSQLKETF
jgi:hypothetical protein